MAYNTVIFFTKNMKAKSACLGVGLVVIGIIIALLVVGAVLFPAKRVYTEAQLNQGFSQGVANQAASDNPVTSLTVSLKQDSAVITGAWKNGAQLNANIVVSSDQKSLQVENVVVTNVAPIAQGILEGIAKSVIQAELNNVVARQGQFKSATIEPGQIVVTYR
jgi:hypothetical protein